MDYTSLLKSKDGKKSRVGIIGATRGYGYTLLAQIPKVELMELRLICARHTEECEEVLAGLGYRTGGTHGQCLNIGSDQVPVRVIIKYKFNLFL